MQGNAKVLETLADLLASELSAASTYFVHSKMRDNWGYPDLAKRAYDDSMDEMRHAEKLIERIIYFEGTPNLQRLNRIREVSARSLPQLARIAWRAELRKEPGCGTQ